MNKKKNTGRNGHETLSSHVSQKNTRKRQTVVVEQEKSDTASVISKVELSCMSEKMEHNRGYISEALRK